ncbi:CRISPR-associated protein Cas3 [Candidatus Omnitrophus magneticus]|uniref:CRISPR-associated protein Cas3 n=1 Tax=Candidatus Omnitrophus magneticus TaxID=1609969 RepID=A0A0F0CP10_9BACT|nr:CRISPR-associated protein Cas3 [Candidatus Omnitrophus magneticus]
MHTYDDYTGTILRELVKTLRDLQCTVIILSATLTDKHRHAIMGIPFNESKLLPAPYPLISVYSQEEESAVGIEITEESQVSLCISANDDTAIDEVIKRAESGEQIIWIENTIVDAQERYCILATKAKEIGIDCGLLHSRFIKIDRKKIEDKWVNLLGKNKKKIRRETGRILVGTQILEQSLDIDADFLVTRLCPIDMLFQRLGRLWRHRENDDIRPRDARHEAWILAPKLKDAIENKNSFGKSAKVYSPYILCRTLDVVQNVLSINLPSDIRSLLEETYKERHEEGSMRIYKQEIEEERKKLAGLAFRGISRLGKTLPESKAYTRYSEIETKVYFSISKEKGKCSPSPLDSFPLLMKLAPAASLIP